MLEAYAAVCRKLAKVLSFFETELSASARSTPTRRPSSRRRSSPRRSLRRRRRRLCGDARQRADSVERMQPQEAPAFDQALVGKRLEVLWKYHDKDTGEPILIWSTGRVARVADGLTDKKSARGNRSCCRPAWCCGSGTQIRSLLGRWRGRPGCTCCQRSGRQAAGLQLAV